MKHGWCSRCGVAYDTPTRPACECAGEPPAAVSRQRSNLRPEVQAYFARVRDLRYVPKD